MTEKELSQCHYLNIEIEKLQEELKKLDGKEYKAANLSGMPPGGNISDNTAKIATEIAEIHELIALKIRECMIARQRIERYISTVYDAEMRVIIRLRCINFLSWEEIAAELIVLDDNGNVVKEQDRTTVAKKFKKFLENN